VQKRVAMLNRSLIILICISMVGVTVLPASMLPCCCKFKGAKMRAEDAPGCCALRKAGPPVLKQTARERSCCSARQLSEAPAQATCCSQQVSVKVPCGKCRCLEHMQVVALSGYMGGEVNLRTSAVHTATLPPSTLVSVDRRIASVIPDDYSPKNVVLLKTCTLLI